MNLMQNISLSMLIRVVFHAERVMKRLGQGLIHISARISGLVLEYILKMTTGFYQGPVGR